MKITTNISNDLTTSKVEKMVGSSDKSYTANKVAVRNNVSELTDTNGNPTKEAYQNAVNKLNEFMEHTQRNSKFVFHDKLDKYYVEIVDSLTNEVVKEVPPKALLDSYYEMQKLLGKMFDQQV